MKKARADHTATLLNPAATCTTASPCKVLAAGRIAGNAGGGDTAEIYTYDSDDPRLIDFDDEWTVTSSLANARSNHTATLLANGKVLVTGGLDGAGPAALNSAVLYTP
jgi:formylmethanofuran dehydrogenase subunit A